MNPINITPRLTALRQLMLEHHIDYYYVPGTDPHKNEYVPDHWQRRRWISHFSGSAGDALIAKDHAYLWTDPRYFLQAEYQLDTKLYQLMKLSQPGVSNIDQWLLAQADGFTFAVDPKVITMAQAQRFAQVAAAKNARLYYLDENLIDTIWHDQPALPTTTIQLFTQQYAGIAAQDKLQTLRTELQHKQCNALIINDLDSIAWTLNIRGNDVIYNPLVISQLILTPQHTYLFVDAKKLNPSINNYFTDLKITVRPYTDFQAALQHLTGKVWVDPDRCNHWIATQLQSAELYHSTSPTILAKAVKNTVEQQGMRKAHIIDALAVIQFLYWLEMHWRDGITELSAAKKLNALRLAHPDCVDLSFATISGFAEHGAIVHYSVSAETDITINDTSLYLVDSGGQYVMGTTDITRTIHLGTPTEQQKHHYTLVLQGHLNIRHLIFPQGTSGEHINAFAHAPLWREALDYGHGTGHGVGCYLCVHEFPPMISARQMNQPFQPGMIVSNEPGLYLTGHYGIRIENLCLTQEVYPQTQSATNHGPFFGFDDLTLVPYCKKLIEKSALNQQEITAINAYHEKIFNTLQPLLNDTEIINWLRTATLPL